MKLLTRKWAPNAHSLIATPSKMQISPNHNEWWPNGPDQLFKFYDLPEASSCISLLIIRMTNDSKPENEYNRQNQFELMRRMLIIFLTQVIRYFTYFCPLIQHSSHLSVEPKDQPTLVWLVGPSFIKIPVAGFNGVSIYNAIYYSSPFPSLLYDDHDLNDHVAVRPAEYIASCGWALI